MRKHCLGFCAAISILLLIGLATFWCWSRSHSGYVRLHQGVHFVAFYPAPSALTITTWNDPKTAAATQNESLNRMGTWPTTAGAYAYMVNRAGLQWEHLGVEWSVLKNLDHGRTLIVPNGMLLATFALFPLLWLRGMNGRWQAMPVLTK